MQLKFNPAWRYLAATQPRKHGYAAFCNRVSPNGAGYLVRFMGNGLSVTVNSLFNSFYTSILPDLSFDEINTLVKTLRKPKNKAGISRLACDGVSGKKTVPSWNHRRIYSIPDQWLRKLVAHLAKLECSAEIGFAIDFASNPDYSEQYKFFGLSLYSGKTAVEMAKSWKLPVKYIEAVQYLFFDFSLMPKDRLAHVATLRQLVQVGYLDDADFHLYKRVFDMGDLALKVQVDPHSLNEAEQAKVKSYLSTSMVSNVLALEISKGSKRDAIEFHRIATDLSRISIEAEKVANIRASTRFLEARAAELGSVTGNIDESCEEIDNLLKSFVTRETFDMNVRTLEDIHAE